MISPSLFVAPIWDTTGHQKSTSHFDQTVSQRSEGILIPKKWTFLPKVSKRLVSLHFLNLFSYVWFQQTQIAISFGFRWSRAVWGGPLNKDAELLQISENSIDLCGWCLLLATQCLAMWCLPGVEGESVQQEKYPPTNISLWKRKKSFKRYLWMKIC